MSSVAALTVPTVAATVPSGSWCCRCTATIAVGSCAASAPDATRSLAPDGIASSRGCNTARTGTGRSAPAARAARHTAVSAARCTSWPQACMAPVRAAQGALVASLIGSASSSARRATHGPSSPPIRTSRPVSATTGASGASSAAATVAAVWYSSPDGSAPACSACRSSTAASSSAANPARSLAASSAMVTAVLVTAAPRRRQALRRRTGRRQATGPPHEPPRSVTGWRKAGPA